VGILPLADTTKQEDQILQQTESPYSRVSDTSPVAINTIVRAGAEAASTLE
jgi:hypothetical protein